ncbi:MAG: hypothetical protein KBA46_04180 [Candidatus Omnitrophica bacterium]|nr:hypothetical protein [Candidatus Omnitrophota bacterium]
MIKVRTAEDIYPAIKELVTFLKNNKYEHTANILEHRMYKVSWTSRTELFEELSLVLRQFLKTDGGKLETFITKQINQILSILETNC